MTSRIGPLGKIIGNSGEYVRRELAKTRQTLDPNRTAAKTTLYRFQTQEDIDKWVHGSDQSTGGFTTSHFELAPDGKGARFHGNMSLRIKPEFEGLYRGGYAGIKTRTKKSLFGRIHDNIAPYQYIVARARVGRPPSIRDAWFMNLRTANMSPTHVWQHRLFFRSVGEEFETLVLPLSEFGYRAAGNMIESGDEMDKENIEMIGFSVLGGNAGLQGPYELFLDEVYATNNVDID